MEMIYEKIEIVSLESLLDIYLVRKKVYKTVYQTEDFIGYLQYVSDINIILDSING